MAGSTISTIPAGAEAGDGGPLADVEPVPLGFDGLGIRIGWALPDTIYTRGVDEAKALIEATAQYNSTIVAAIAAGDATRARAASEARVAVIRQTGNSAVRIIVATGFMGLCFWAVARSLHMHIAWSLAAPLGTVAVGAATLSLRWLIARRARSAAASLPPSEQPEDVDQP